MSLIICPHCNEEIQVDPSLGGQEVDCPYCGNRCTVPFNLDTQPPAPVAMIPSQTGSTAETSFPVTVESSPRAMFGKYLPTVVAMLLVLVVSFVLLFLGLWGGAVVIWFLLGFVVIWVLFKGVFVYLRITNTTYNIYANKITESSYVFKFLGVRNNLVNLSQTRQIRSFSNSYFDIWFFNCGSVVITVSGDAADFVVKDVYQPGAIKAKLEQICFGHASASEAGAFEAE